MLRRLAPRCLRVLARHRGKEPGIAAFDASIGVRAPLFITAYDNARRFAKRRMEERTEAKGSLEDLLYKVRIWAPQVARDIEHVIAGEFGENPNVPDDTIGDAKVLIEHVTKRAEEGKEPLPYTEALLEDLGTALARAEAECDEAEAAQAELGALRKQVRETGRALEADLVAFRRVLRTVIGSGHPDYQKLRRERARAADADDDANAPSLPTPPINTQPAEEAPASP